ncbi:hypothetical protein [Streptomyces sp. NPDC014623]|uniref:hypothetical protein n=1 Tax=Streptomyces sp. NPDC014623 TaxID=3364875 RepID=UPI0036FD10B7
MRLRLGPTVRHRVLVGRLRIPRGRAGVSLQETAVVLRAHPTTVRRTETGLDTHRAASS